MGINAKKKRKAGLWLIGARGSIAATVMIGAFALRRGLIPPTGMVTGAPPFAGLGLLEVGDIEFGGCDIRWESLLDSAQRAMGEGIALDREILDEIGPNLEKVESNICAGTVRNCGDMIQNLAEGVTVDSKTLSEELLEIRQNFRDFKERNGLGSVVVINLASTEPPLRLTSCHQDLDAFERCVNNNDFDAVQASTLYSYGAILEGCPYVNFTPSNGALIPALIQLAETRGVPVMGNDGKTGETLVKSALAPMFLSRNLEILSWEGVNMLGNMDGMVLNDPKNCETKLKSKDKVLQKIMGYAPHSKVHIHYVPSLADQKTAWDFIHFQGFLGGKMSLQFTWQGYDSILAAPLVLDLARLAELAKRRGEAGLMPQLASFFKSPQGVDEYRHEAQYEMLLEYVTRV
ncbi:MAG: inositol-3-phosphate synthase [Thermodesulfobacteriota bacterium]|nr:inositol-3-phosphate synthase [Thermodesulfobacteriota bacterium]